GSASAMMVNSKWVRKIARERGGEARSMSKALNAAAKSGAERRVRALDRRGASEADVRLQVPPTAPSKARELLPEEFAYFETHIPELRAKASGAYILIKGCEIGGFFERQLDAVHAGWDRYGAVPFLVARLPDDAEPLFYPANQAHR